MNILITNVSVANDKNYTKKNYTDENGNAIEGFMTSEPPIKSVIKRLADESNFLDRIIYIESDSVRSKLFVNPETKERITSGNQLKQNIKNYANQNNYKIPEYTESEDIIPISDVPNDKDVSFAVFKVNKRIEKLIPKNDELNIFIESNGGVRYVLSMLLSVTKNLEKQHKNVHIKEILSMVNNENKNIIITNQKKVYDTSELISIIDEYVNYGRPNGLIRYVHNLFIDYPESDQIKKDVDEILKKLFRVAEDIQLCRTKMILDHFYNTKKGGILNLISAFQVNYRDIEDSSVGIFMYILDRLNYEYRDLIPQNNEQMENAVLNLPKIIRWCIKKDYIQQALTFCGERVPDYLIQSKKIQLSSLFQHWLAVEKTKDYEPNYYFIANMRKVFFEKLNEIKINTVFNEMKNTNSGLFLAEKWNSAIKNKYNILLPVTPLMSEIAEKAINFVENYRKVNENNLNRKVLETLFNDNNMDPSLLDIKHKISNNRESQTLELSLCGKCIDKTGNISNYDLYKQDKDLIIIKVLNTIISNNLRQNIDLNPYIDLIDGLYENENIIFKESLKNKYVESQSNKFYILDGIDCGQINTNIAKEKLQKILYLYSMCKEQRNMLNHAHFSEEDAIIAMSSEQLKILMEAFLKECE